MTAQIKSVKALVEACQSRQFVMCCYYDDPSEPDYMGSDAVKALAALEACDEMYVRIHDPLMNERVGIALIVNGLEEDERIADVGGPRLNALLDAETDIDRWKA